MNTKKILKYESIYCNESTSRVKVNHWINILHFHKSSYNLQTSIKIFKNLILKLEEYGDHCI